jgi:hypothetical protein
VSTQNLYCLCILLTCISAPIHAIEVIRRTENLESDSPEAWAIFYMTSVTLPAGLGTPQHRKLGSIEFGVEMGSIPSLSKEERTVGFNGTKEEDLNKSPVFARPSLGIGLPGDFSLMLAYVPPLQVYGLKPNLFAAILERQLLQHNAYSVGARLYAQAGTVQGAFTCSNNVAKETPGSSQNPYGCEEKSSDEATQRYAGFELSNSYRIEALGGLSPYFAISANYLDTKVHVDATTFGILDRTHLAADSWSYGFSTGLSYPIDQRLSFNAGMYYSPLKVRRDFDATTSENDEFMNFRAILRYQLR